MSEAVRSFIRSQGIGAAVGNIILNPALAWVLNRQAAYVGDGEIVTDTAITCVLMTLIVTLFVVSGTRRELEAGRITRAEGFAGGGLLSWLPRKGWALGLLLGVVAALVIAPLTLGVLRLLGITGLPVLGFALFKAVWTPLVAFAVARWVVLRQLQPLQPIPAT